MTNIQKADTTAIINYAQECAKCSLQDCAPEQVDSTLALTNVQIANLYLIDSDDCVEVSDEQKEIFGAEYKKEIAFQRDE